MNAPDAASLRAEAGRWLARAAEDRAMVTLALGATPPLVDPAAYHPQQAVEKALKALLVLRAAAVPRTHDIAHLLALTGRPPGLDAPQAEELAATTSWAVQTRYPDVEDSGGPTRDEFGAMLPILDALLSAVGEANVASRGDA